MLLGLTGAAVLITDRTNMGADSLLGDGLIIINAISYAIYFILVKPLMQYYPPTQVIRWVFTFGAIGIIPFGIPQALDLQESGMHLQEILALSTVVNTSGGRLHHRILYLFSARLCDDHRDPFSE
jgi:drug/metabolite transporter (DMT)-like permease